MKNIAAKKNSKSSGQARVLLLALILVLVVLLYFILAYAPKKTDIAIKQKTEPMFAELIKKDSKDAVEKPTEQAVEKTSEQARGDKSDLLMVKSVQFTPKQPTVSDNIKAEAKTNYEAQGITYEYRWMLNQKPIDDIKGDTLPTGKFKKYDYISVVITPYMKGNKSYPFISDAIVIQNSVPTLDMKLLKERQKIDEPIEIQLTSSDPDGDKVTFSLDAPMLEGMTINKETGKIIWKPQKQQKGTYLFGASAADPDGAKITKTFELKLE